MCLQVQVQVQQMKCKMKGTMLSLSKSVFICLISVMRLVLFSIITPVILVHSFVLLRYRVNRIRCIPCHDVLVTQAFRVATQCC